MLVNSIYWICFHLKKWIPSEKCQHKLPAMCMWVWWISLPVSLPPFPFFLPSSAPLLLLSGTNELIVSLCKVLRAGVYNLPPFWLKSRVIPSKALKASPLALRSHTGSLVMLLEVEKFFISTFWSWAARSPQTSLSPAGISLRQAEPWRCEWPGPTQRQQTHILTRDPSMELMGHQNWATKVSELGSCCPMGGSVQWLRETLLSHVI